ncbi:MAG: hypothetical protein QME57_05135 [Patescibacteria group bacterium]|nr:hypothetical protein [Patescibacteria group bacterium]
MSNPSVSGKGIDVFFPTASQHQPGDKTVMPKTATVEKQKSRTEKYRRQWQSEGKVQISLWLPKEIAQKLKLQAFQQNKKVSEFAAELFSSVLLK